MQETNFCITHDDTKTIEGSRRANICYTAKKCYILRVIIFL